MLPKRSPLKGSRHRKANTDNSKTECYFKRNEITIEDYCVFLRVK